MTRAAALALALVAAAGCRRETREFSDVAAAARRPAPPARSTNAPGPGAPGRDAAPPIATRGEDVARNAWDVSQGQQLYQWFNCVGCHANGGGGMGPPLMDETWIYGGDPVSIYRSIAEGRPNGMPAFGGRIPEQQLWQLVAYVRSLSGNTPADTRAARTDHMSALPAQSLAHPEGPNPPSQPRFSPPAKEPPR